MLAIAVLVTLGGVLAILLVFGHHVEKQVDDRANRIEREFNQIRKDIDTRLPPGGAVPSATPSPTETPSPSPSPSPTETASPTGTPSPSATATDTPASDSGSTTDPNRTETRP
jgi:hypothetical protein